MERIASNTELFVGDVLHYYRRGELLTRSFIIGKDGYIMKSGPRYGEIKFYYELVFPYPLKIGKFPLSSAHDFGEMFNDGETKFGVACMSTSWVASHPLNVIRRCNADEYDCSNCEGRFICLTNMPSYDNKLSHLKEYPRYSNIPWLSGVPIVGDVPYW